MSSKRARKETVVDLVSPDKSPESSEAKELERLRKEINHKNEMITSLEEFLGKMQRGLCCQVCTELLYQPFNLSCGHVFCYGCLVDWFKEAKRCPTCRERVTEKPTVSYLIKEMVHAYVRRAELADTECTGMRWNKEQAEADQQVKNHQQDLFPGLFLRHVPRPANRTVDAEDGVMRCIRCNWEVEGPSCMHCGLIFSDNEDDEEDEDFEGFEEGSEMEEDTNHTDEYSSEDEHWYSEEEELGDYARMARRLSEEHYREELLRGMWSDDEDDEMIDHEAEEDGSGSGDEEEDEEEEDEYDSFIDSREESEIYADAEEGGDESDSSIPYHTRENNYYNQHHPSSDRREDHAEDEEEEEKDEDEDEDEDEEGDEEEEPPRRRTLRHRGQQSSSQDEDESDGTLGRRNAPTTRSSHVVSPVRSRRSHIVISSDQE